MKKNKGNGRGDKHEEREMKTTHKNPESGDGPIGESYLPQRTEVMKERGEKEQERSRRREEQNADEHRRVQAE